MAEPIGNLVVKFGYDGTEFHNGITNTIREIKSLESKVKSVSNSHKLFGATTDSLRRQLTITKDLYKQNNHLLGLKERILNKSRNALAELNKAYADGSIKTEEFNAKQDKLKRTILNGEKQLTDIVTKMETLRASYGNISRQLLESENSFFRYGTSISNSSKKLEEFGRKAVTISDYMTQLSTATLVGGSFFVKQAIQFESSLAGVSKTTNLTGSELKKFAEEIKNLSTEIPIGVNGLNEIAESAGQLGIHKENLISFTDTIAKLGTATNIVGSEGAKALAQFVNVMGSSQTAFSNIGSAIVELGNNFATTEAEILQMAKGIAGTGKQIKLTESEVLGIATALSSVGISAERGGSAISKAMLSMYTAVETGSDKLQEFSNVAGLTSEQFANLFRSNPAEAIAKFVEGLGHANEKGTTAIALLEELDVKEVRLRDTLLRAGGASKLFANAISLSNKAYRENEALEREFQIRKETTASQLEILKNKVINASISLGEAFLPALNELIDNSDGVIDKLKGVANWFTNLDSGTKKAIVNFVLFGATISPVLSILSRLTTVAGATGQGISSLLISLGKLKIEKGVASSMIDLTKGVSSVGSVSVTSAGSLSKLLLSLTPLAPTILGVAGALGVMYLAWKTFDKTIGEKWRAEERAKEWGGTVTKEMDKVLDKTKSFSSETKQLLNKSLIVDKDNIQTIHSSYKGLFDSMRESLKQYTEENKRVYESLPSIAKKYATDELNARINKVQEAEEHISKTEQRINEIYAKASEERRQLTATEIREIERLRSEAERKLAVTIGKTAKQQKQIFDNLRSSLKTFNDTEIDEQVARIEKSNEKIKNSYIESQNAIKEAYHEGQLNRLEYNSAMNDLEQQDLKARQSNALSIYGLLTEKINRLKGINNLEAEQQRVHLESLLAQLGFSVEEIGALYSQQEERTKLHASLISDYSNQLVVELAENTVKANESWEQLITDEKTGEIVSNIKEVLTQAINTKDGWDNLQFILKNADLTSNAKEVIEEALKSTGKWDGLEAEAKLKLQSNEVAEKLQLAIQKAGEWDHLDFKAKEMILKSNFTEQQAKTVEIQKLWNNSEFVEQFLKIDTNATDSKQKIDELLSSYIKSLEQSKVPIVYNTSSNANGTRIQVDKFTEILKQNQNVAKKGSSFNTTTNAKTTKGTVNDLTNSIQQAQKISSLGSNFNANTNAGSITPIVKGFNDEVARAYDKTVTFTTRKVTVNVNTYETPTTKKPYYYAKGTNYHSGGLAILGDGGQHEPYLTPQGTFGVSPKTDTVYDLPSGTKVWSSVGNFISDIKRFPKLLKYSNLLPKFADGTAQSFLNKTNKYSDVFKKAGLSSAGNTVNEGDTNITIQVHVQGDSEPNPIMIAKWTQLIEKEMARKLQVKSIMKGVAT